jgi:hypothetical protein
MACPYFPVRAKHSGNNLTVKTLNTLTECFAPTGAPNNYLLR